MNVKTKPSAPKDPLVTTRLVPTHAFATKDL